MEKKSSETSKSIFRNVLYGFSTWIMPLGLSFIATPILVRSLGNEDYGIYALILGFIGYSFNLNLGRAVTKYIAEYRANGQTHKINYIISNTLLLNICVGLTGALTICLLANWLVTDVFLIAEEVRAKTIGAMYISAAIIFVTMLNQVFNSILQGLQRFDVYSRIFIGNSYAILIGNIILALSGFGLNGLLIWNLIALIVTCLITVVLAKILMPEFKFEFDLKGESLKLILKFSGGIIGYQILANLLLLFERGWIIRQFGEEQLTYYVVSMLLGIYIHSFVSSLLLVLFPLVSELNQNLEKLKNLYLKATKIICFLVCFLAISLIIESKTFLYLWMGSEFAEKAWFLLILHVITFSLTAILVVSWQMTEGLGYPNYNFFVFSFCLIISIFLMIYLTADYGIQGVAIGRLAGFGTLFLSVFYVERWFFKQVQVRFWLRLAGMIGLAMIFAGGLEKIIIANLAVTWLTFFIATLCGGMIYCIVLWLLGFITDEEKILFRQILSR
jgi:O-antigen/teichoic acid export membrane protein